MGPENGEGFSHLKAMMQRHKIPTVFLEKQEFSQHIPNVNLTDGNGALIDNHAGVLYVDRALRAVQRVFQSSGGVIKDGEKVIDITPGAVVTVTTGSGVYGGGESSDHSGTLGHHSTHTGLPLLLKVVKISVCYWKEKIPGTYSVGQRFPCFIEMEPEEGEYDIYGLPSNEYPGLMKVTPDRNFVLDSHSTYGNTIIGAGFSAFRLPTALLPSAQLLYWWLGKN